MSDETGGKTIVTPVAMPTSLDVRRAFDIYVFGRNRTLGPAEKAAAVPGGETGPASPGDGDELAGPAQRGTVAVPEELRFDRNAGTWRSP